MKSPLTLALDCSLGGFSLALAGGDMAAPVAHADSTPKASDGFHTTLEKVCGENGVQVADIRRVIATVGPGSFTGIRMGLAVGEALRLVTPAVELVGVSTLHAVAWQIVRDAAPATPFTVALDAAGGMAYAQTFDATGLAMGDPECLLLTHLPPYQQTDIPIFAPPLLISIAHPLPVLDATILISVAQTNPLPFAPTYIKQLTYKASA